VLDRNGQDVAVGFVAGEARAAALVRAVAATGQMASLYAPTCDRNEHGRSNLRSVLFALRAACGRRRRRDLQRSCRSA